MALKRPVRDVSERDADALAQRLADRPYGTEKPDADPLVRTTVTLPKSLLVQLEDMSRENKRAGREPKSVSAIVRLAVEGYFKG